MKMKMSTGAKVALGLGALVVVYMIFKATQASGTAVPSSQGSGVLTLPPIQPISNAGIVAIDVQPPLVPLTLSMN